MSKNIFWFIKDKKYRNKIIIVLILIIILLFIYCFFMKSNEEVNSQDDYISRLELKLKDSLKKIDGVQDVSVVINVKSGLETVLASKIETKKDGDIIETTETPILVNGKTITLKELNPEIIGVLIVAKGADNFKVYYNIQNATTSLLNIKSSQVEILAMK